MTAETELQATFDALVETILDAPGGAPADAYNALISAQENANDTAAENDFAYHSPAWFRVALDTYTFIAGA